MKPKKIDAASELASCYAFQPVCLSRVIGSDSERVQCKTCKELQIICPRTICFSQLTSRDYLVFTILWSENMGTTCAKSILEVGTAWASLDEPPVMTTTNSLFFETGQVLPLWLTRVCFRPGRVSGVAISSSIICYVHCQSIIHCCVYSACHV